MFCGSVAEESTKLSDTFELKFVIMKFVSILIVILGVYLVKDVNAMPNPAVQSIVKANTPENRKICLMTVQDNVELS